MADKLQLAGIFENGYGLIPKKVMTDNRLSIEAKAIYAYLMSYCGGGSTAYPPVSLIQLHLKIGRQRYYKHFKKLIQAGYIKVIKHKAAGGKFTNNVYEIQANPEPIANKENSPCADFPHTANPHMDNQTLITTGSNNNTIYNKKEKENGAVPAMHCENVHALHRPPLSLACPDNVAFAIGYYLDKYKRVKRRSHPALKRNQLQRVSETLDAFINEWSLSEQSLSDMIDRFFDSNIDTDHNINHFATEGILQNRMYEVAY